MEASRSPDGGGDGGASTSGGSGAGSPTMPHVRGRSSTGLHPRRPLRKNAPPTSATLAPFYRTIMDEDSPFRHYRESYIGAYEVGEDVPLARELDRDLRGYEGSTSCFSGVSAPIEATIPRARGARTAGGTRRRSRRPVRPRA